MKYRRRWRPGATYFLTAHLADRRRELLVVHIELLRAAMRHAMEEHPFTLGAMVVLPEHFHALLTLPHDDSDCAARVASTQAAFSSSLAPTASVSSAGLGKRAHDLWQPGNWVHPIRDDEDLDRHVAYIHWNPVLHGLVDTPSAWPHSSIHRYIANGLLPSDWGSTGVTASGPSQFGERSD